MRDDKGWPPDETPVAERAAVHATLRNDKPVAVLKLTDIAGDTRDVQLTEDAAYDVLDGVMKFILQLRKTR